MKFYFSGDLSDVKAKWKPREGIFTQSGDKIAHYLLKNGKKKAMRRLNFYMNRAGKNLSNRAELERAKSIISNAT
jgi:hypothetical protein